MDMMSDMLEEGSSEHSKKIAKPRTVSDASRSYSDQTTLPRSVLLTDKGVTKPRSVSYEDLQEKGTTPKPRTAGDSTGKAEPRSVSFSLEDLQEEGMVVHGVKTNTTSAKVRLILSVRSRTSIYDERSLIFDTAATAHLIRNLDLFDGAPVRIDDDDVSFVGFDTNSGHTFAVHRGMLKAPFEGIEAYYVPNCVGNIISEPRFREEFHIADIREADHLEDTMVASRKGSKSYSPSLKWSRSLEGVFTCDLRQLDRRKEPILASLSPKPLRLEETHCRTVLAIAAGTYGKRSCGDHRDFPYDSS